MNLNDQRQWYEDWHTDGDKTLPVERMKQSMRILSISHAMQDLTATETLVLGCGTGKEIAIIDSDNIVALDLSHTAVTYARSQIDTASYLQGDGMKTPFPDNSFNTILTSEVLEHILEPELMMREITRILKPGGHVIITTPNWMSFFGLVRKLAELILQREVTSDDQPVDNWSTPSSLQNLVESAGLNVTNLRGAWYFPPTGLGYRRLPDKMMANMFRLFISMERWLQSAQPKWGHLLVMVARLPN